MKSGLMIATTTVLSIFAAGSALAAFADVDSDADGSVSAEEFAAAYPDMTGDVFTAIDVNADGVITEEEHVAAVDAGVLPAE